MIKKALLFAGAALTLLGAGCVSVKQPASAGLGTFRSADKGETWTEINILPTAQGVKSLASIKVNRVFSDPNDNNAYYMGTRGQGLFMTLDKGDTWQFISYFQGKFIYGLAVDPINKCTVYVTDSSGIFKTTDCTRTWTQIHTVQSGSKLIALAIDAGNNSTIYAAIEDGTVLQSLNGGVSWKQIKKFNTTLGDLVTDPKVPGRFYVASTVSGIVRSDDGGENYVDITNELKNFSAGLAFYRLVIDPSTKDSLFWMSKYGLFHSTNAGQTWNEVKLVTSPGIVNIYNFAINPKNPNELYYTGTIFGSDPSISSSKLYKSIDGGVTWITRKLPSTAIPVFLYVHPEQNNILFVGFTSLQ